MMHAKRVVRSTPACVAAGIPKIKKHNPYLFAKNRIWNEYDL
jgi:hypothetical protein